ncbi:MAG TPA: hypothetical protein VJ851_02060 [Jatrophihabitans sp.]|nr:hypothetical protein [Jatrophihabitans sp.]
MLAQPPPIRRHRFLWWATALVVAVVVVVGGVLLALHHRSSYPGTALRHPASNSRQVNRTIERRAQDFVSALRAGDVSRVRSLADPASDGDIAAFVTAFGHRNVQIARLEASDLGNKTADLNLVVPCKDGTQQQFTVLFDWYRTSYIRSSWYAVIHKLGTPDVLPSGCPAP